jgi:hypothetical protein
MGAMFFANTQHCANAPCGANNTMPMIIGINKLNHLHFFIKKSFQFAAGFSTVPISPSDVVWAPTCGNPPSFYSCFPFQAELRVRAKKEMPHCGIG